MLRVTLTLSDMLKLQTEPLADCSRHDYFARGEPCRSFKLMALNPQVLTAWPNSMRCISKTWRPPSGRAFWS